MSKQLPVVVWADIPLAAWPQLAPLARLRGLDGVRAWLTRYSGLPRARVAALSRHDLDMIRKDGEAWLADYRQRRGV